MQLFNYHRTTTKKMKELSERYRIGEISVSSENDELNWGHHDWLRTSIELSNDVPYESKDKKYWKLVCKYGYVDKTLDSVNSKDTGYYCFWFKHKDKFHALYLGMGVLSNRIKKGFERLTLTEQWDHNHLYVSFFKTEPTKEEEADLIWNHGPIYNKQKNVIEGPYLENCAALHEFQTA